MRGAAFDEPEEVPIDSESQAGAVYEVFGLRLRSEIPLPELTPATDPRDAVAVTITIGPVPAPAIDATEVDAALRVAPGAVWFEAPAGRYGVFDGARIVVAPRPGAAAADIRLYLLGTVLGALCHQRGLLPLHAAVVAINGEAVAFAGPSGAGKSTLAARFQALGYPVLADDLCVIAPGADGEVRARAGLARVKLWGDSPALAGAPLEGLARIGADIDKFSLPLHPVPGEARPILRRIYALAAPGEAVGGFVRLSGPEAVGAILDNVYRWPMAVALGQSGVLFAQVLAAARACAVFTVAHAHDPADPWRSFDALRAHALAKI